MGFGLFVVELSWNELMFVGKKGMVFKMNSQYINK